MLPIAADSSVLVYSDFRQRHEGDATKHQFESYDSQLRRRWVTTVHLPAGTEVRSLAADGAVPYALCTTEGDGRQLAVLRFAPNTGTGQVFRYRLPVMIAPLTFEVSGEAFVVATAYRQQTVLRLPLRDSAAGQFLPILSSPATSVTDAVPEPGGLTVLTAERLPETSRLLLRPFRTAVFPLVIPRLQLIQGPPPASLTAGRTVAVASRAARRLVVGTYATHDPRLAQGIFSTLLAPESEALEAPIAPDPPIYYYDLPTLPHYYDRFRPRHRARAIARAQRRRASGRETPARARLLLHRPLPLPDGGYALVAEQYYPRYRSGDPWNYRGFTPGFANLRGFAYGLPGYAGAYDPVNVWDRGPDGYVFTQALVFAFDATGRLRWQNSFVLGNLTRPDLAATVAATVQPSGAIALAAPTDNPERVRELVLSSTTTTVEKPRATALRPADPATERLTDARATQVLPWHPGHLLVVGYQRIRPRGQREREVFVLEEIEKM